MGYFEEILVNGFSDIFGLSDIIGLVLIAFFVGFVTVQNTRMDHKAAVLIPVLFLATPFFSWLTILLAIGGGLLFYFIAKRWFN